MLRSASRPPLGQDLLHARRVLEVVHAVAPLRFWMGSRVSQVPALQARIVTVERERDTAREENVRLRDKLLELARKCGYCRGAGTIPEKQGPPSPCPVCTHIRKVLAP